VIVDRPQKGTPEHEAFLIGYLGPMFGRMPDWGLRLSLTKETPSWYREMRNLELARRARLESDDP